MIIQVYELELTPFELRGRLADATLILMLFLMRELFCASPVLFVAAITWIWCFVNWPLPVAIASAYILYVRSTKK
jgi:hypothetical protein